MKAKPTILSLMGLIALIAVGLAAVRSNDGLSAAIIFVLTVAVLCTGTLVAFYRRGAWAGFAVFGWAQFLICQPQTAPVPGPTSLSMGIAYQLLIQFHDTTSAMPHLTVRIRDFRMFVDIGDENPLLLAQSKVGASLFGSIPVHGLRACLCLWSVFVGFLGAIVGGFIARYCDEAHCRGVERALQRHQESRRDES